MKVSPRRLAARLQNPKLHIALEAGAAALCVNAELRDTIEQISSIVNRALAEPRDDDASVLVSIASICEEVLD